MRLWFARLAAKLTAVGRGGVGGEAADRKRRSVAVLKREGVPFIEHLPAIESAAETTLRPVEEVALRAITLGVVATKGQTGDQRLTTALVDRFRVRGALSPKELAFVEHPEPSQHDRIQFTWRYECHAVLFWALGFIKALPRPDRVVNVAEIAPILADRGRDRFIAEANLRPVAEILDATDLIYRYHWAVTDARINGRPAPAGLDPGVVMERHYALNWLVGGEDWDDVATHT
jgi:hypothetical protein